LANDFKSVALATFALTFDEVDEDYVAIGNPGIAAYPITMECWIKTGGSGDWADDMVLMSYCSSSEAGTQMGVYIESDGADQGKVAVRAYKTTAGEEQIGTTSVDDNAWHHIAVVFDSASRRSLYIDGALEFTQTTATTLAPADLDQFTIGAWSDNSVLSAYFNGTIDEVRLWNVSRTTNEISTYRTRSVNPGATGFTGYWNIEEGSGTTTSNQTATSGIDGSLLSNLPAGDGPNWLGNIDTDGDGIVNPNDDYPHDPLRAFNNYWPATPYTLAFEDLWPSMGDYDMNDMVVKYRFNSITNANNELVEAFGNFTLVASGASLSKGFGFGLPNAGINDADFSVIIPTAQKEEGYITFDGNGTEAGQNGEVVVIAHEKLPWKGNTIEGEYFGTYPFWVKFNMIATDKTADYFAFDTWNPFFILRVGEDNFDRRQELHLPGYSPSYIATQWDPNPAVERMYFDTLNDGSNFPTGGASGNLWYKTNENAFSWHINFGQYYPWGLDIPDDFEWAIEADSQHNPAAGLYRFTLIEAYEYFDDWASSNGTTHTDWYDSPSNTTFVYQHP
jgi:LruC domain-containing protein